MGGSGPGGAIVLALILVGAGRAGVGAASAPPRPYPLYCAGLVVGMSTDEDVRRMYGNGLAINEGGHGVTRYFVSAERTVTLKVETGVDRLVEAVTLMRGARVPTAGKGSAATSRLTEQARLWLGIRLGDTRAYVVRQFGKPGKESRSGTTRVVRYEADHRTNPYVLFYEAELRFENERLTEVRLYNGE